MDTYFSKLIGHGFTQINTDSNFTIFTARFRLRSASYDPTSRSRHRDHRGFFLLLCRRPTFNFYNTIGHPVLTGETTAKEKLICLRQAEFLLLITITGYISIWIYNQSREAAVSLSWAPSPAQAKK